MSGFSELGQSWSAPSLPRCANCPSPVDVAVFGGGYDPYFDTPNATAANSSGAMGRTIYMVDLVTGAKRTIPALPSGMTYAVPSDPLTFDVNGDGIFDRGYIGDMGGNLWRIDDRFNVTRLFHTPNNQKSTTSRTRSSTTAR